MKIYIILLHFGSSKITNKCLESILKKEKKFEKIVVVDNSSELRIQDLVRGKKIKVIKNEKNLGYAGGMNSGIKYSLINGATHMLLINNDTFFEEPIVLPLAKFLEINKDAGIVGPAIKFNRNSRTIYDLGGKVNLSFGKTKHRELTNINSKLKLENKTDYISGCCMMIKKEVFEKIGFLDEDFFLYYEDVNFCLRAKKAGFNTYCLPGLYIFHSLSKSVGKGSIKAIYYQTKSAIIFGRKHVKSRTLNILFIFLQVIYILSKQIFNRESGVTKFLGM